MALMMHSLRFRLLISPVIIVLVTVGTTFLFIALYTSWAFQRYVERDTIIASLLAEHSTNPDQAHIQSEVERLAEQSGDRIVLTDLSGQVLADSEQKLLGQALTPTGTTVRQELLPPRNPVRVPLVGPVPEQAALSSPTVSAAAMLSSTMPLLAYFGARGSQTLGPSQLILLQSINQSLVVAALVSTAVGLILTLTLLRRILTPIETLTTAALKLEGGDFSHRVPITSRDEIGVLTRAFNVMADGLVRLEQLRKNMVNDVAHELRTPLTNIRGYLEAMRDQVIQPNPQTIELIYSEAMLLNRLIDDLQDLAMAEAGQLRLVREPIDLAARIATTVEVLQPALQGRQIDVQIDLADGPLLVDADSGRLGQVLSNLVNNALAHTPPGGRVAISAERRDGEVLVAVRDTGAGIASEDLPFIFERFYRADRSRARRTGGVGLGLTIVKQLVERHGGRIWVESTPGKGSTFLFTLPAVASC
jgi:signal transduction histidine kinase